MNNKKENLKTLLTVQEMDAIKDGERLLKKYPSPRPEKETITKIKATVNAAVQQKKRTRIYRRIAAAALILLAAGTVLHYSGRSADISVGPVQVFSWEHTDDDGTGELSLLAEEIEQLEADVFAFRLNDTAPYYSEDNLLLLEFEIELIEIETDFWKG